MFLPIKYESRNTLADIAASALHVTCSRYANQGVGVMAQLFEYADADSGEVIFTELVTTQADGSLRAHDYLLLSNGLWRDSFGEVASSIGELLPVELGAARLVGREVLGAVSLEAANV